MTVNHHTPKRKAAGGYHTTQTAFKNTHTNVAPHYKKFHTSPKRRDTLRSTPELLGLVLENAVIDSGAFTHALSWVFSRPITLVYGRDGLVRKAGRMAESMFSTSRPPVVLEKTTSGFQSHSGAEAMTNVNRTPTTRASTITRQQAIENALSTALYFIRQPHSETTLQAATGRAIRAATMLKQACSESSINGRA
ncbi:MAG: hypothetical protein Q7U05_08380 [Polaromonas sp.]|nr:hypothetical protein [Polaromonas sp.]